MDFLNVLEDHILQIFLFLEIRHELYLYSKFDNKLVKVSLEWKF